MLTAETQLAKVLVVELFLTMAELDDEDDQHDRDDEPPAHTVPVRRAELTRQAS